MSGKALQNGFSAGSTAWYPPRVSRIEKVYQGKFRTLLRLAGARRLEAGVNWFLSRARARAGSDPVKRNEILVDLESRLFKQLARASRSGCPPLPASRFPVPSHFLFLCDAGLGGLARWLRAAGYQTVWFPGIADHELLDRAVDRRAFLLTTDSLLLERRLLRERLIPALWLLPTLKVLQQLEIVFRELHLTVRGSRCMKCGGELKRVDKASVWDRIPPKTRLWLDEYYVCRNCNHLFWHGTHWQNIRRRLSALQPALAP
jgi:uncharacterized protein